MSLDAIGLVSDNVDASKAFYQLLGLTLKEVGQGHYEAVTDSGIRLMVDTVDLMKTVNPKWVKPEGSKVALCFKQHSVAAVDTCYQQLINAGAVGQNPPWDAFWGQRYACVLDPDGNQVEIFADRPSADTLSSTK